jgi:hypothetical protein
MKIEQREIFYRIFFVVVGCCFIFMALFFSTDRIVAINYFPDKTAPPVNWQTKICLIFAILSFIEAAFTMMRDKLK